MKHMIKKTLVALPFLFSHMLYADNISSTNKNYFSFEHYSATPPLNKFGSVDVNAKIPEDIQVPKAPAFLGGPNDTPTVLSKKWSNIIPSQPELDARAYILVNEENGDILAAKNANLRLAPASITKLMLLYVAQKQLKSGRIHLDDQVIVPKEAWATGGSRMFLKPGSSVPVKLLIQGIIVDSGNDAAVTLANYLSGSQSTTVSLMNQSLKHLKMNNTHFSDVMGLPAPAHFSTALDLSKLAGGIITEYPEYYSWFGQKYLTYNGITQPNFNRLLFIYKYADGMKTGSTGAAGFSLVSSAKQNNQRLIAVVLGAKSDNEVASLSKSLLSYGFNFFSTKTIFKNHNKIEQVKVWFGDKKQLNVGVNHDVNISLPRNYHGKIESVAKINPNLEAPIRKGEIIGSVTIKLNGDKLKKVNLIALDDVKKGSFIQIIEDHIKKFFTSIV